MTTNPSAKPARKGLKAWQIILIVLLVILLALCATVGIVWHNELATAFSIRKVMPADDSHYDGAVYRMDVSGGYYFDEFLAQGGASSDTELISFITSSITKNLISMGLSESEIGCSAFTATTAEGDRVFGRNYDFSRTNTCVVYTNPGNGRHASWSTVDLAFIGIDRNSEVNGLMDYISCLAAPYAPLDGINDAGVSCGIFMSYQGPEDSAFPTNQQTEKPDITSTTMLRMILDYASSVEEAVELVSAYDLHDSASTSFHYMVADATGRSAILEWVPDTTDAEDTDGSARRLNVIYNDADPLSGATDWQCVTNFLVTPGYYVNDEDKMGWDRYQTLRDALTESNGAVENDEAAMALLALVSRRLWNNDDANHITVHSVVYNLTDRTMQWVANEHYGEEAYTLSFGF